MGAARTGKALLRGARALRASGQGFTWAAGREAYTSAKHIGRSKAQLKARFNVSTPPPNGVSSWANQRMADTAIGRAVAGGANDIEAWLKTAKAGEITHFDVRTTVPGLYVANAAAKAKIVWSTRIVVQADATSTSGFTIFNAYPIP